MLVKGPAVVFRPTTAQPIGELMKPHRTVRQRQGREGTDWPMSADSPVGPAFLINRPGRGRVLTLASSPDVATASEHHVVEARKLLRGAVRLFHPEPLVEVEAPAWVEAVVTENGSPPTLRIHLLAYASPPQSIPARERPYVIPGLIEEAPMYRATIRIRRPIAEASAWNKSTVLSHEAGRLDLTVSDIHEVIVVRTGGVLRE